MMDGKRWNVSGRVLDTSTYGPTSLSSCSWLLKRVSWTSDGLCAGNMGLDLGPKAGATSPTSAMKTRPWAGIKVTEEETSNSNENGFRGHICRNEWGRTIYGQLWLWTLTLHTFSITDTLLYSTLRDQSLSLPLSISLPDPRRHLWRNSVAQCGG
jgi:hypothetical protein